MTTLQASETRSVKGSTSSVTSSRKTIAKPITFNSYIHKALKIVHPELNIAKLSVMQLDILIKIFSARLAAIAIQVAHGADRATISVEDVITAVRLLIPANLCENAVAQGNKSIVMYDDGKSSVKNKASRSGLVFPPHISEKFLRVQGSPSHIAASSLHVAHKAPIFMASIIEYIVVQFLELAGNQARDSKRQTINIRHLLLASRNDSELSCFMDILGFNWLGGGVVPFIHESLLPSKEKQKQLAAKRRKARKDAETTAPRKALPGSKALRDIRSLQKGYGLLQRKEHFKRFVKEQAASYRSGEDTDLHYGAGVIEYLQAFVEDRAIAVYGEAVKAMIHAGREGVEGRDITFVWNLIKPIGKDTHDQAGVDQLAEPGLQRLGKRGGAKRISPTCFPVIRDIMAFYVSRVLNAIFELMARQKVKTITLNYLRRGASLVGINLPVDATRRRVKKAGLPGAVEVEDIPLPEEEADDVDVDEVDDVEDADEVDDVDADEVDDVEDADEVEDVEDVEADEVNDAE